MGRNICFFSQGAIEFDKAVSLKTTEFNSIEEFYEARSSGNVVHKITVPVLFVNAADDPFMDINVRPCLGRGCLH